MSISYDAEVIAAMRAQGLDPGPTLQWTGKRVRFPAPGERRNMKGGASWYRAYPDSPQTVVWGCWKTGAEGKWRASENGKRDEYDPEKWAMIQAKQEAEDRERDEEAARVAEECRVRWANASEPSSGHPYLEKKGITTFPNLRQEGDGVLLVRMTSFDEGNPVVSLQQIDAQGEKRFVTGARALGARCTIGGAHLLHRRKNARKTAIYVCEGYATGWSIYRATNSTVVVAFSTANLMAVAKALRERYGADQSIVICADNDRWSLTHRGPNPGVIYAQEAAKEIDAFLAIPDFRDLSTKPTDFNDLMIAEGLDAVKEWLDPGRSELARIVAEPGDGSPEPTPSIEEWRQSIGAPEEEGEAGSPAPSAEEAAHWLEDAAFRCLGFDRDVYFYFPYETGQVKPVTAAQHTPNTFITMADLSWWEEHFAAKNGVNWKMAQSVLNRACHRKGVFNNNHVRGRGCWRVEDGEGNSGIVLHLGDRLLAPDAKTFVKPVRYECPEGRIYESLARLAGPSAKTALDVEATRQILGLFQDLLWLDGSSPYLLAGWTVLAPFCGVLPWRPHAWVTGNSGSGKTTVVKELVKPLLGDMLLWVEGVTTEAGIRQSLKCDALPVLFDEADENNPRKGARIQAILGLARSASSTSHGATLAKGTTSGLAMHFHIRSMFLLSSVNAALREESDRQRIAILQLKSKEHLAPGDKDAHWSHYQPRLAKVQTSLGRELIARTLGWLRDGRLDATLDVFRDTASKAMGDPRFGDQYGTLYAGAWTLMADEPPDAHEASALMGSCDLSGQLHDQAPEGQRVLEAILQRRERIEGGDGTRTVAVGRLIQAVAEGATLPGAIPPRDADQALRDFGLRVDPTDNGCLMIANSSKWVREALQDTPYSLSFRQLLLRIPGVDCNDNKGVRFHPGLVSKVTRVPLKALRLTDEANEG